MRVDAYSRNIQGQGATVSVAANPAAALKDGATVKAEVLSVSEDGMVLKLENGETITATRPHSPEIAAGDTLRLTVTGRAGGKVIMQFAEEGNAAVKQMLHEMGKPVNAKNEAIMVSFIKHGVTPSPEHFAAMESVLSAFEGLSADSASFLMANNIPVTGEAASMLESFQNGSAKLSGLLMELDAALSGLETGEPEQARAPMGQYSPETAGAFRRESATGRTLDLSAVREAASEIPVADMDEMPAPARPNATASPAEGGARPQAVGNIPEDVGKHIDAPANVAGSVTAGDAAETAEPGIAFRTNESASDAKAPSREDAMDLPRDARASGDGDVMREAHAQTARSAVGVIRDQIQALFRRVSDADPATLAKSLDSAKIIRELSQIAERIQAELSGISGSARESVTSAMRNIESTARFMDMITNFSTYFHVPLAIGDKRSNLDIYVFGDKKRKNRIDPANATMFLSLDTVNLGRVESFVRLTDKNVECDFKLLPEVIGFLKGNMAGLSKMLEADGYRLSRVGFSAQREASGPMEVSYEQVKARRRYMIDLKI